MSEIGTCTHSPLVCRSCKYLDQSDWEQVYFSTRTVSKILVLVFGNQSTDFTMDVYVLSRTSYSTLHVQLMLCKTQGFELDRSEKNYGSKLASTTMFKSVGSEKNRRGLKVGQYPLLVFRRK